MTDQQNYTDISDIVQSAHDVFDIQSWGRHPEAEPWPAPREQVDHIELQEAVEQEPDAEIQEYVQDRAFTPVSIPKELVEMGVEEVDQPVQYPKHTTVKLPISDEKIAEGLKKPIDSSFRWLAETCKYILHKAHIRLKIAHGKAERVMEK